MHNDLDVIAQLEELSGKRFETGWKQYWGRPCYQLKQGRITWLSLPEAKLSDLAPLASLTALTNLYLGSNQISELAPLASLTALTELNLVDNQISELAPLASLTALTDLYLGSNQISDLAPLARLPQLRWLRLNKNPLKLLPLSARQVTSIDLDYDQASLAKEIPASILAQGLPAICSYSRERADAPQRWVSKLVVVGCGGTGKTSLLRRLKGENFRLDEETTHGIRLDQLNLRHPHQDVTMTLYTWDFGGQDIYHATHQFFLTEGALVLVTWNARLGPEQGKVDYWLENIRARAPQAPILLVATHVDQRRPDIALQELQRRFPRLLGQIAIDSSKDLGLVELKQALAQHAAALPLMGERWPASWLRAADHLCRRKRGKLPPYLTSVEVHRKLVAGGLKQKDVHPFLARWLHQLGEILWFFDDPELGELAVLNPQWVTQSISLVLESEEVEKQGGLLTRPHLQRLWPEMSPTIQDHLLALMERFDLSYKVQHRQDVSLVVERLPFEPPAYEATWAAEARKPEICLHLQLKTSLPPGIPTWFIARMHRFSLSLHWRYGALFKDRESLGFIHANAERRTVTLRVRGPNPWPFFSRMRDALEETLDRYPGLELDRLIPCTCGRHKQQPCGHFFDLELVEMAEARGRETIECPRNLEGVSVQELLYGLTRRSARRWAERDSSTQEHGAMLERLIYGQEELLHRFRLHEKRHQETLELLQRQFMRQFRLEQSRVESRVPALFSLTPVDRNTRFEKLVGQQLRLQLYCQQPGACHATEAGGCYTFKADPNWLIAAKPLLTEVCKVLKCVLPLALPGSGILVPDAAVIESDLKLMDGLVKSVDVLLQQELQQGGERQLQRAEGADLRWLRQLLEKQDKAMIWGRLSPTPTPEGEILWLCEKHRKLYRTP